MRRYEVWAPPAHCSGLKSFAYGIRGQAHINRTLKGAAFCAVWARRGGGGERDMKKDAGQRAVNVLTGGAVSTIITELAHLMGKRK